MKNLFVIFLVLMFFGCEKKQNKTDKKTSVTADSAVVDKRLPEKDSVLQNWENYYRINNPDFAIDNFTESEVQPITFTETFSPSLIDGSLDPVYKPFLIYSPDLTKYIDFDSYQWQIAPDGNASFEADQNVLLVDLQKKKIRQIAFFGPSFWIEEGYWKDENLAVLIGNTYEKVPFYIEFNFSENTKKYFQANDTIRFDKPYSQARLEHKGITLE